MAFTWPNLCLWVVILCPQLKPKNLKNLKYLKPKKMAKKQVFTSPGTEHHLLSANHCLYSWLFTSAACARNRKLATAFCTH